MKGINNTNNNLETEEIEGDLAFVVFLSLRTDKTSDYIGVVDLDTVKFFMIVSPS